MSVLACSLAEKAGQAFDAIFSQQWLLSQSDPGSLPGFRKFSLGAWGLWAGSTLDVAFAEEPEKSIAVAVLGQCIDASGKYVTDEVLAAHLKESTDAAALAAELEMLGGRYAFVIVASDFARVYLDPSSCLGAVYNPELRRVAASLFLVLDRPVEPDTDYPFHQIAAPSAGGRFAFGRTPDTGVRRLLANHYLDLASFTPHRHWPREDTDFTCPMTQSAIEERIETVVRRQQVILSALTEAVRPAMLPVSGGDDSRVLLALSAGMLDRYDLLFVHRANDISRRDVAIACELAATLKIDLKVVDVVDDEALQRRPRYARRMNVRRRLAMGILEGGPDERRRDIEVRAALPEGGMVLRGNVTDVSKAVLWRPVGIREFIRTGGSSHDPAIGLRLLMLGARDAHENEWCLSAYEEWMGSLPSNARCRTLDFSSLEHFRTHGQGAQFYAMNRNFYQTPSADRTILEALISLPPHLRDRFYINDMIIERCAPALSGVRFTRETANEMRSKRPPLAATLAAGPERL